MKTNFKSDNFAKNAVHIKPLVSLVNLYSITKSGLECLLKFQLVAPFNWRHRIVEQIQRYSALTYCI
jgi:hypothetical protein